MVLGYHIILTGYGHWLANDPRGSMSREAYAPELAALAERHFGRRAAQPPREELRAFYREAQKRLAHELLWFDTAERQALAEAFGRVVRAHRLTCYACAVLNNHAHLLLRKHRMKAEEMSAALKRAGRAALIGAGLAPAGHPVFSADCCHVYKSDVPALRTCVAYIRGNFAKHRMSEPAYDYITRYDGWPFPNRSSARREQ